MHVRKAGSVQERADELQYLSIAAAQKKEVEDWATGILQRLKKMFALWIKFRGEMKSYAKALASMVQPSNNLYTCA